MSHSLTHPHRVFDPLLRTLHWTLALSIVVLVATSQLAEAFEHGPYEKAIWNVHILSGYVLTAGLVTRLLWGLVGPASARWRDLWHPAVWKDSLTHLRLPAKHRAGHDPLASLAYLFAYGVMAFMVVTGLGLAAAEYNAGPLAAWFGNADWLEDVLGEPHEAGFVLMLGFIGLHLAALAFHQWRGERVAQSMITGKQYHMVESGVHHD
ncbi:cytochrome b/b6 domain-containing protein [Thiobacillus sedimenti]|uniref:Cytochrome b/b6 domain-containing protein n=1 Tax=Thiobacillus sedimenti TaxID=3110231 RepID=A0ABZ1CJ80_9PROT|nr:cytochrome b/b6 domain-containing protein [Thiobacillus sp. SCUT-2]WRS39450.1 cytochrome b/b6 domain-containing protein [Thiobacillus sp. SCUT-2]